MSWDEFYQNETAKVFDAAGSLPPVRETRERNFWGVGVLKAPFTGVARGASEVAASLMDVSKAAGLAYAPAHADPMELFDKVKAEAGAKARDEAAKRLQSEQEAGTYLVSGEGSEIRSASEFLKPDAKTASTSENLVFSFTKVATKLAGGSLMGPHGIALAAGEEGLTQSEELRQQGVSIGARSAVGAVTAGFTALAPLPMYGKTLAKTAGLYLIGGPGGFMAQQQASRSILEAADYGEIAKQFDPLDTTGLLVSSLVPIPFMAKGLARNIKDVRVGAKSVEVGTAKDFAGKVEEPPPKVSQEHVDAAMTYNLVRLHDAQAKVMPVVEAAAVIRNQATHSMVAPELIDAKSAAPDGPPVVVRDDAGVTAISGARVIEEAQAAGKPLDVVEIPRSEYERLKDTHKPEDIADAAVVSVAQKAQAEKLQEAAPVEAKTETAEQPARPEPPQEVSAAKEAARQIEEGVKTFEEAKQGLTPEASNLLAGILESGVNKRRAQAILDDYARGIEARPGEPRVNVAADAVEAARAGTVSTPVKEGLKPDQVAESARDMTGRRVDEILKADPDLPVGKDENGNTITAEDAVREAQRQGREGTADELGTNDYGLIEAAVQCALTFGGSA
jgi:hypothetical protein